MSAQGKATGRVETCPRWRVAPGGLRVVDDIGIVAEVIETSFRSTPELLDCARLIAQAPALLAERDALRAALEAIAQVLDGSQPKDIPGALMVARAALAGKGEA